MELTLEPETEADPKTRPWSLPKLWVEETEGRGKGWPFLSPSESKHENPEDEPPAAAAAAAEEATAGVEEKSLLTLGELRERVSSKL